MNLSDILTKKIDVFDNYINSSNNMNAELAQT